MSLSLFPCLTVEWERGREIQDREEDEEKEEIKKSGDIFPPAVQRVEIWCREGRGWGNALIAPIFRPNLWPP